MGNARTFKQIVKEYWLLVPFFAVLSLAFKTGIDSGIREIMLANMKTMTTHARVMSCSESGPKIDRCAVEYDWKANGLHYSAQGACSDCRYLPTGSQIEITYAANKPSISRIGNQEFQWSSLEALAILLILLLWSVIDSAVVKEGPKKLGMQLIFGQIIKSRGTWSDRTGKRQYHIIVRYRVISPIGTRLESYGEAIRDGRTDLPPSGSSVAILYKDENFFYPI